MLSDKNRFKHAQLRSYIEMMRQGFIYQEDDWHKQLSHFCMSLTQLETRYAHGGRYNMRNEEAATWSRKAQGDSPPGVECAGFVEMVLYGLKEIEGDIFNYRGLRRVSSVTKFYREAMKASGFPDYKEKWIPDGGKTITDYNGMGEWAQTPYLLYFRKEMAPIAGDMWPHPGDCVYFLYKDGRGFHTHVGIWVLLSATEGLVHSSPSSGWDDKDGPKFTPCDSKYWTGFLEPQRTMWEEYFGASATRLKEHMA